MGADTGAARKVRIVNCQITAARPQDETAWRGLWQGYLDFYNVGIDPAITAATWARAMDSDGPLVLRLAWRDEIASGFAIHHCHASTWVAGNDCYLEDLYVAETARGSGLGRALIDDAMAMARAAGCHRFYWHTDKGNSRARALYDSYAQSDGHVRYRVTL